MAGAVAGLTSAWIGRRESVGREITEAASSGPDAKGPMWGSVTEQLAVLCGVVCDRAEHPRLTPFEWSTAILI